MAHLTIQQAFEVARKSHQAGRLGEAEQLYRRIIAHAPGHAEALHHLGIIAAQMGQNEMAVDLIRRAIAARPGYAEAYSNLGNALKELGQLDQAIEAHQTAVTLSPGYALAYCNLGNALGQKGENDKAAAAYREAICLRPNFPEAHYNLGALLSDGGHFEAAVAAYRQAVVCRPNFPEAHFNLSIALRELGQLDPAIAACRQAIVLRPDYAEAYDNLGIALQEKGQTADAIAAFRKAIALAPEYAQAYSNLGNVLREAGEFDEAIAACRRAMALRPDLADAHRNLGAVLADSGQMQDAIASYRRAVELQPTCAEAHWSLAAALLQSGELKQGFEKYEWRWKCKDFPSPVRSFPQPQWDGSPLQGRTLLIHTEQGLGDTIQFIRYLPLVAQRGGKLIVELPAELVRLLQPLIGNGKVVVRGELLPAFDVHCPLLSLPRVFGTTLETIPAQTPYLHASEKLADAWRQKLQENASGLNVALAWAGSPSHAGDRERSIPPAQLAPLIDTPGVTFYSLQKTDPAPQFRLRSSEMRLIDLMPEVNDYADTAAFIANIDLVISVDTSVAHLAGAMGRLVWVLLPFSPDWRWLLDRGDSPWHPTMRLFRQSRRGQWGDVIAKATAALSQWKHPD